MIRPCDISLGNLGPGSETRPLAGCFRSHAADYAAAFLVLVCKEAKDWVPISMVDVKAIMDKYDHTREWYSVDGLVRLKLNEFITFSNKSEYITLTHKFFEALYPFCSN